MRRPLIVAVTVAAHLFSRAEPAPAATLAPHAEVRGVEVSTGDLRQAGGPWRPIAWDDLGTTRLRPGAYDLRFRAAGGPDAVAVPPCAGRGRVAVDGREVASATPGPVVIPLGPGVHEIVVALLVSGFERRIACGDRPRAGAPFQTVEGLGTLAFPSPHAARGGGQAVVYVPPNGNSNKPRPLLVGLHPWNGSIWTYAAYADLLREARARDVLLLMPSGLGNSLYVADAEDEVMRAVDAFSEVVPVDSHAVSLWGASMGGAGATTIAFHRPDRFAGVTSFFGDSTYDRSTYVRFVLRSEAAAHAVNALDVVDNARSLPVWLIHGENDRTSPVRQSDVLAAALTDRGFSVRFDRVAGAGHDGALVARFLPQVVAAAASARVAEGVARVTYRSVRPNDTEAYGVRIERISRMGDAFVDLERRDDGVHVLSADGVRTLLLVPGALGTSAEHPPPLVFEGRGDLTARWDMRR